MTTRTPLPLYEEILLLALDDDTGTTSSCGMFTNAMGGAIMAELLLLGTIALAADKKKSVTARPGAAVADPLLAEALALVHKEKKTKAASHWAMKFAHLKDLKHRAARQLVAKGVLKEETGSVLKIFKRTIYPEADGGPERELRDRLERAIFGSSPDVDERTITVIALARATGMLDKVADKKRLKARKDRIEKLASGQLAAKATKEAVDAMMAAIAAASIASTVVVTTSS